MCGNRKVLIDNKTHDEGKKAEQVHRLLSLVDEIRRRNRGGSYTDDMFHKIKVKFNCVMASACNSYTLKLFPRGYLYR